jgi:hypothetical protein
VELNFLAGLGDYTGYQTFKYAADGTLQWQCVNPTRSVASLSHGLAFDTQGEVFVTGRFEWNAQTSTSSYGTYKLDPNGNYVWTNLFPNDASTASVGLALATDATGNVFVTGDSTNATTGGDIVTIKYDNNGNQKWLQRYDGPGHSNDAGNAIAVDNSGNVYVAGYETEANGFTSMILIKYSPVTIQKQSNGNVILHAYGSPGESFNLQASTNLQTWQDLGTIAADTNGDVLFDDTNAPLFPARFYYTVPQ